MHAYIRAYKIVGLVYLLDVGNAFVDFILFMTTVAFVRLLYR